MAPRKKPAENAQAKGSSDQPEIEDSQDESALDQSLDTVRDILFGAQVKESKLRAKELEDQINRSVDALRKEMDGHLKAVRKEIADLAARLAKDAGKSADSLAARFSDAHEAITELDVSTKKAASDLYDQLTTERDALESRVATWNEDFARQLDSAVAQLQHEKTARRTLAIMLANMAEALAAEDAED
jgi:gas vesicle protein